MLQVNDLHGEKIFPTGPTALVHKSAAPLRAGVYPFMLPPMSTRETFLAEVETYLVRSGMTDRAFGLATMNDHKFVPRLRAGGDTTLDTADKVRRWMRENRPARPRKRAEPQPATTAA